MSHVSKALAKIRPFCKGLSIESLEAGLRSSKLKAREYTQLKRDVKAHAQALEILIKEAKWEAKAIPEQLRNFDIKRSIDKASLEGQA